MRLKIVQAGDPVLRQEARRLTRAEIQSSDIQRLIADMRETMHDAPGVGLAAPQVGLSIQLAVVEDRPESLRDLRPEQLAERERVPVPFQVLINPVITSRSDDTAEFFEGCLSVPAFAAVVPRARIVRVDFLDERGEPRVLEARGWHARILQHEIDHLKGTLFVDHMRTRTFTSGDNFNRHWKERTIAEVLAK
jgi:peptide deformylase